TIDFEYSIQLKGSNDLQFTPLGKTTAIQLQSSWPDPSFTGNFLPDERTVTEQGFEASWKVLHLNRNFPQRWLDNAYTDLLGSTAFGVQLYLPADDYQSVMRASKYGLMTIVLTFLVFFLVEIMGKIRIHPIQYILVGLAVSLFYILLISISEHSSFNFAYGIATAGIIGMIYLYSLVVFKNMKHSTILLGVLLGIYAFVFVTLQLVDYALLIGSIGLTLILAVTMYLTRNIDWFNLNNSKSLLLNAEA
ncbi:MAG: cell envelope integrity protein CreD, partial [Bacteroidia bacterium]|nr:cell envelope integrity protein CreD [Bacteroidia bacterium]